MQPDQVSSSVLDIPNAYVALSEFLDDPNCHKCSILEICLKRLHKDAERGARDCPPKTLQALRETVPFPRYYRRRGCRRCVPSEILCDYLTPAQYESDAVGV